MLAILAAAALAAQAARPVSRPNDPVYMIGVGPGESCAAWLSSPAKEQEGFTWLRGYWTGLNGAAVFSGGSANSNVGHTTDGWGIVGEIKKVCEAEPTLPPMFAAQRVYSRFEREGR